MSFKPASAFSHTSAIQLRLIKHLRILRIILAASPKQLQAHIKDCVINNNSLMVYVTSAVWASQLRFCTAQIQQAVNAQSNERINRVRIRVLRPEPFKMQEEITKIINSHINNGCLKIIIDLTNVDYLDSSGLSTLISVKTKLGKHTGELRIVGLKGKAKEVFDLAGLTDLFNLFDSREKAFEGF